MTLSPENKEWIRDCMIQRKRILKGKHVHWCPEWDELPMDETCIEWPCGCSVSDAAPQT